MAPPLVIDQNQVDEALEVFEGAVTAAEKDHIN
jgi:hypothetical protein